MAKDVLTALSEIQKDKDLAVKFSSDPESVLKKLGVDSSKLQITKGIKKTGAQEQGITVCASAGVIVCASVGGEVGATAMQNQTAAKRRT